MAKCFYAALLAATLAGSFGASSQEIIAGVLMGEARGEGKVGMLAVAEVIRNRALERGKTYVEVVTQPKQFSCLGGTTPEALAAKHAKKAQWVVAMEVSAALHRSPRTLGNRVKGATYFVSPPAKPRWLREMRVVAKIGNHVFYSER